MMENLPKMEEQPAELLFPREGYWLVDILNLNENFINICWWKFKRGKMMENLPKMEEQAAELVVHEMLPRGRCWLV